MDGCAPNEHDFSIRAGNNWPPVTWQILESEDPDVLYPITGSTFRLVVKWGDDEIVHSSEDVGGALTVDETASTVTWHYTLEESREMPLGRMSRYELERRTGGTQTTWAAGSIAVEDGINTD